MSKHCLGRILTILVVLLLFCVNTQAAQLTAQKIRYSNTPDKVRLVVDLDGAPAFKGQDGVGRRIALDLGAAVMGKDIKDIIISDPVFRQAKLFVVDKNKLLLDIMLHTETEYKAFVLKAPWRLVVDIMKNYRRQDENIIAPGLTYTVFHELRAGAPLKMHTLTIETDKWEIQPILAGGQVLGRGRLQEAAVKNKAAAAVNACYFGPDGWVIGNLKMSGNIVGSERMDRTAFLVYPDGKMEIAPVSYRGEVAAGNGKLPVNGVNRVRMNDELVVYSREYAPVTGTNIYGYEVSLDADGRITNINPEGNSPLKTQGLVLSGHGKAVDFLNGLRLGDTVDFRQTLGEKGDRATTVLGAGPRLVAGGKINVAGQEENFPPDITNGRAPRTAIGLMRDGRVLLVVADGRSSASRGLTLSELAEKMIELGVADAMNLDGGGSSEMVVEGAIVNGPSDGQERKISVGIGVFAKDGQ